MKRCLLAALGSIVLAAPAHAVDTATLRLVAYVPVSCSLDVIGAGVSGSQLTMTIRRNCNTGHRLVLNGAYDDALGNLTYRLNNDVLAAAGGSASIGQPERYYDGIDQLVVEASDGDSVDLIRFAQSLNVSLDTIG